MGGPDPHGRPDSRSILEPRRWQREALEIWNRGGRGVVSVVTGGGKTAFALQAFAHLREENRDLRLIVVVPTLALLDQWAVSLRLDLGLPEDQIALFSGESKARQARGANIVVINTARKGVERLCDVENSLFVVDECHRAGSPENARALDVRARYRLGLSATPTRQFDDGFERFVEPALGPVIYEYDYAAAKRDGLLPDIELRNFRFALTPAEQVTYDRLSAQIARAWAASDDPEHDPRLKQLLIRRAGVSIQSPRRVVAAVAVAEMYPEKGLVFHERIAGAERIARLLDKRGHRVGLYHSGLGPAIRRRNLEIFRFGQITKLVTCRALDEGLNVPDASVALVAASTRSTRQRIQRLGRVLRALPGKDIATVCTLFATQPEHDALASEASEMEGVAETRWYEVRSG